MQSQINDQQRKKWRNAVERMWYRFRLAGWLSAVDQAREVVLLHWL